MASFRTLYHRDPEVVASAPGRVNLIGEHTDYNGGFVLPTAIPQRTTVSLARRSDRTVNVFSANQQDGVRAYTLGKETPGQGWLDYVQGITFVLAKHGHVLAGCDLVIESDVPLGSGLSSSAALDVALERVFRQAFGLILDDKQIAILGQQSENQFVGAQVGIMDPLACSLSEPHRALFVDARSLEYQSITLPAHADLVVINSGLAHQHAAGDYNTRRAECEEACRLLGVTLLRELSHGDLPKIQALPSPLDRRARHVVTENARVVDAVAALKSGDLAKVGRLFNASHDSQRDDYQVSIPEIDTLVDLARNDPSIYGARLTGGGFGGSIVMLARGGHGAAAATRIAVSYRRQTGHPATILATLTGLPS